MSKFSYTYSMIYNPGVIFTPGMVPGLPRQNIGGSSGDDVLVGNNGEADVINGWGGNDVLRDGQNDFVKYVSGVVVSDDAMYGGNGADRLICRSGADVLDGGNGVDEFVFYANTDHAWGHIYYDDGESITIENSDEGHNLTRLGNGDLKAEVTIAPGVEQVIRLHDSDGWANTGDINWE